jgi:hypothetical protein
MKKIAIAVRKTVATPQKKVVIAMMTCKLMLLV